MKSIKQTNKKIKNKRKIMNEDHLNLVTLRGNRTNTKTVKKEEVKKYHAMSPMQLEESIKDSLKKYTETKMKLNKAFANTSQLQKILEKYKSSALIALDVLCKYVTSKETEEDLLACPHVSKVYQSFITVGIGLDIVSTSIPVEKWSSYRKLFKLSETHSQLHPRLTGGTTINENLAFQKARREFNDIHSWPQSPVPAQPVYGTIE